MLKTNRQQFCRGTIEEWYLPNKMRLNSEKCVFVMTIHKTSEPNVFQYTLFNFKLYPKASLLNIAMILSDPSHKS